MNRVENCMASQVAESGDGVRPLEIVSATTLPACAAVIDEAGAAVRVVEATKHAGIETPIRRAFAGYDQGILHNPRHRTGQASLHGATAALSFSRLFGIMQG